MEAGMTETPRKRGFLCVAGKASKKTSTALLLIAAVSSGSASAAPTTVTLTSVADATLFSEDGALASGADDGTFVGYTRANATRRTLVRFDLSAIPSNAAVSNATLSMSVTRALNSPLDIDVTVHRMLATWGEGTSTAAVGGGAGGQATPDSATWTHRFWPTTPWTTTGGDFEATSSGSRLIGPVNTYAWPSSTGMVSDVQGWVQNPTSNHGWMVIAAEFGAIVTAKRLASREFATASQRPTLTITYDIPPTGDTRAVPLPAYAVLLAAIAIAVAGMRRST
jgi:hypothetical protein